MSDFFNEIFQAVIAGVFVAIIGWIFKLTIVDCFRYKSKFNGFWEEVAYKADGSIKKKFLHSVKHNPRSNKFHGKCTRIFPVGEHKTNKISGVITNNEFVYIVYVSNPNVPAYTCGVVHTTLNADFQYKGLYTKYNSDARHSGDKIEEIPIVIKKITKAQAKSLIKGNS